MSNKIDELSELLDKMNNGQMPETSDQEAADLLEVAALLRKSDLPACPPEHILSTTIERAAAGLAAAKASRRTAWMYSGVLGAAAALFIFFGIHGFPTLQEVATVVTPSPQSPSTSVFENAGIPTRQNAPDQKQKPISQESTPVAAEAPPSSASPSTAKTPVSSPSDKTTPAVSRRATHPAPSVKSVSPPLVAEKTASPKLTPLNLPGYTPDSIAHDPSSGAIRQVFGRGTPKELIITQRILPQEAKNIAFQVQTNTIQDAENIKTEGSKTTHKVVIIIQGQEITLEGCQSKQELTDLAQKMKAANP